MNDSRKYAAYPSNLDIPQSFERLRDHFLQSQYEEDIGCCENIRYTLNVDSTRSLRADDFDEFLKSLRIYPRPLPIWTHSHWKHSTAPKFMCAIEVRDSGLEVTVESKDINLIAAIHEKARDTFGAWNPPAHKSPSLDRYKLKRTVFLAHRFDDEGRGAAHILNLFLIRLGFSISEGEGYETRDIPSKVSDRIRGQDIFLCLLTPGDHTWVLSEAAFAKALGKYIVVLAQDASASNRGIIGNDYEHIPFPRGNIEKAFSDLVQALP